MRTRIRLISLGLCIAILGLLGATSAGAVQRVYAGQLRFGFGDAGTDLDTIPGGTMGTLENVDTANNAIPPCAAPGATVTPSGMGNAPPITPNGAGPQTATINFFGLAEVATTGAGDIDPNAPISFLKVTPTTGGVNHWGVTTSCPIYTNGVPGGFLFRRTQMAQFEWPVANGTMAPNGGAIPLLTPAGGVSQTAITTMQGAGGLQRIGASVGPNRYGGSIAMVGTGNTILGFNSIPAFGLPSAIGSLPIPLNLGANGGLGSTSLGAPATIPTLVTATASPPPFKVITNTATQRPPGGPLPPATAPDYPLPPFATAIGFAWTTGAVTAFDSIGNFVTTRTRTGGAVNVAGPFTGATTASLQTVAPAVLFLGITGLTNLGIAITAEMDFKFVPEPGSVAMLAAGVTALGLLYSRRRRNQGL